MIGASEGLYNYFNQNIREEGQEIEIKITKGAKSYTITDDDLVASSVKITKKSVSGASFDIGECYVDSATFTINKNINNYKSLTGAKVTIRIKVNNTDLNLSDNVLLGTFRILQDGIKRTNTLLQVTADSYISKFDKSRKRATFTGDLYDLVMDSCNKCKVTFGMTESAFRALSPNVAKTYEIKKDSSLKTHRDVIMYVAQLIGGFATTTPAGALIFKNYTSNNDVCNVNDNVIVNYSIGDEVYNLSGLGMSVKEKDVYLYRAGEDDDSPYFLNLDTNPIMENCTDDEITSIVDNIWSKLIDLNLNNFSFEFNGNPLIEVGDIVSIPERSLETYVASCEWTYHGKEKISCVSVDKNKRIETQREKQNENKPSKDSKDNRVDDLIKNTTTQTRKVKKTLHTALNLSGGGYVSMVSFFNSVQSNDDALVPLGIIYDTEAANDYNHDKYDLSFSPKVLYKDFASVDYEDFNKDTKGIKAENIKKIIIDISAFKRYVAWGLTRGNIKSNVYDTDGNLITSYDKYYNIPTIPDSTRYSDIIEQKWNNLNLLKSGIYELDYTGNIIGAEYPDISNIYGYSTKIYERIEDGEIFGTKNTIRYEKKQEVFSLQYKTESVLADNVDKYLDITNGQNIEITDKYINDLYEYDIKEDIIRLNFYLPNLLHLYEPTLTIKSMQGLYEDRYYKNNVLQSSSLKDTSNNTNAAFYAYSSNFTEDTTLNNTIEEKIKELNKITSIPVTIEYIKEESYTTTIEGTSNKINENADKTDKNADEIEQLKTDVKKNKANIDILKKQVASNTKKVGAMSNSLGVAKTDIAKLDIRVSKLESSGGSSGGGMTDAQKKQLEQNTKEISTLKTTVSNNTKNISTNTTNITRLTTRVTNLENSGSSGGSGSGITEAERQQIQTNKTDIANLTTRVTNLENSGGSGGSGGSGITEAERQQIQTNKTNIENLTLTVNGHTTSIEDILRRLTILEQGGGGETGEIFKFKSLKLNLVRDNNFTFPNFNLNNYYFNNTYYISDYVSRYFKMTVELTKPNTKQTFRQFYRTDGSQYYIIGTADTESLESSGNIHFDSGNIYSYLDCISKYGEQQIISQPIKIYNYRHLSITESWSNWLNTTTGNLVKTDDGAHIGDTISIPITYKYGFKAVKAENKPDSLNKYYYMINTTGKKESGNIVDWTEINAEPNVATNINFTYNVTGDGARFYLFVSDGQFTYKQDDYYITKLT